MRNITWFNRKKEAFGSPAVHLPLHACPCWLQGQSWTTTGYPTPLLDCYIAWGYKSKKEHLLGQGKGIEYKAFIQKCSQPKLSAERELNLPVTKQYSGCFHGNINPKFFFMYMCILLYKKYYIWLFSHMADWTVQKSQC